MPRNDNDYFYDRYMRKDYDYIPPKENYIPVDPEVEDGEREMAQFIGSREEEPRRINPMAGLGRALGLTSPGGGLSAMMNAMRSRPNTGRREIPPMMASMPNPAMRNTTNFAPDMDIFNNMIQEAEYNYRNKDYDNAASILSQAESLMPNNPQIKKLKLAIKRGTQNKALTQRYQKSNPLMRSLDDSFVDENQVSY